MVAIISAVSSAIQLGVSRCAVALDDLAGVETAATREHLWRLALHAGIADRCRCCGRPELLDNLVAGNCDECEELGRGMTDIGTMAVRGYSRK